MSVEESNKSSCCQWKKSCQFTREFCRHFQRRCSNIVSGSCQFIHEPRMQCILDIKNKCCEFCDNYVILVIIPALIISFLAIGTIYFAIPWSMHLFGQWICTSRGEIFFYNNVTNQTEYIRAYGWKYLVTYGNYHDGCRESGLKIGITMMAIFIGIVVIFTSAC
jgi:hypothetical protein